MATGDAASATDLRLQPVGSNCQSIAPARIETIQECQASCQQAQRINQSFRNDLPGMPIMALRVPEGMTEAPRVLKTNLFRTLL